MENMFILHTKMDNIAILPEVCIFIVEVILVVENKSKATNVFWVWVCRLILHSHTYPIVIKCQLIIRSMVNCKAMFNLGIIILFACKYVAECLQQNLIKRWVSICSDNNFGLVAICSLPFVIMFSRRCIYILEKLQAENKEDIQCSHGYKVKNILIFSDVIYRTYE